MLTALVLVFLIGFNETILLLLLCLHLVLFFMAFVRGHFTSENRKGTVALFAIAILSSLVVILAPGNGFRAAFFPGNHQVLHSFVYSLLQTARFSLDWISNLPLLFASVLCVPLFSKLKAKNGFLAKVLATPLWLSASILIGIVFIGVFPAYWNTKILGQYRTVNAAYFFFIMAWFFNLGCSIEFFEKRMNFLTPPFPAKLRIYMLVAILIAMAGTKNGYKICTDLLYNKIRTFDTEMRERNLKMTLAQVKGEKEVRFDPLSEKPATLFVLELTPDPEHWINTSYASFYGSAKVSLKK